MEEYFWFLLSQFKAEKVSYANEAVCFFLVIGFSKTLVDMIKKPSKSLLWVVILLRYDEYIE